MLPKKNQNSKSVKYMIIHIATVCSRRPFHCKVNHQRFENLNATLIFLFESNIKPLLKAAQHSQEIDLISTQTFVMLTYVFEKLSTYLY